MPAAPRVSVITPTRNRLVLLRETMDSVRNQTFERWEHLVVDDGSEDETAQEVAHRATIDPRIRYIVRNTRSSGANACRNLGLRESRAELIVFLDSDDVLGADCLERRVDVLCRNQDLDFAVFRAAVFEKSPGDLDRLYHPQEPGDDLSRFLALECPWQTSGPIWRRAFLERLGGFDESLLSMQDLELHVRAIANGARYLCFADVDHYIRWGDRSNTSVRQFREAAYIRGIEDVPAKLLHILRAKGLMTWSRRRALHGFGFKVAESWIQSGELLRGIRSWISTYRSLEMPLPLLFSGSLMLVVTRLSRRDEDFSLRLVNKWKGWVRFRQDPALEPPGERKA